MTFEFVFMFDLFDIFNIFNDNVVFKHKLLLALLLLIPLLVLYYYMQRRQRHATVRMSTLAAFSGGSSLRGRLRILLPILRILALTALIVALARPQSVHKEEEITADGIDIFLVMDVSTSMEERDFSPNRLEASKRVAIEFVENRKHDRIGLALFAGEAFTQCPLTTDHRVVNEFLATAKTRMLEGKTAIGTGLATAVNRIKDSKAKSKVIILLTDGINESGEVSPLEAAEIAKEMDVKVYTIAMLSNGLVGRRSMRESTSRYNQRVQYVNKIEQVLVNISKITGGRYFRATSSDALSNVYKSIDELEKTKIEVTTIKRHSEEFYPWIGWALLLLILELLLRYTVFRVVP